MAVEDMKITKWEVEEEGGLSCSLADRFLSDL